MPALLVTGKRKLEGNIKISGAKNAVLPQMAASLLTSEKVTLRNVPNITDVRDMKLTLEAYGVNVKWDKSESTLELQAGMLAIKGRITCKHCCNGATTFSRADLGEIF